jgi:hypothetical protein
MPLSGVALHSDSAALADVESVRPRMTEADELLRRDGREWLGNSK